LLKPATANHFNMTAYRFFSIQKCSGFNVCLQPFRWNLLLKCVSQAEIAKTSQKPLFRGSRSFKVIDVDKSKIPVTSICYDVQQLCTYLQPFSHYTNQQRQNDVF